MMNNNSTTMENDNRPKPFFIIEKINGTRGYAEGKWYTFSEAYSYKRALEIQFPKRQYRVLKCYPCYPQKRKETETEEGQKESQKEPQGFYNREWRPNEG